MEGSRQRCSRTVRFRKGEVRYCGATALYGDVVE